MVGQGNQLPWHLPADLQHFKALTLFKPVLMGRKTYDSIGKLLPDRRNIIISHQKDFKIPGAEVFASLPLALNALRLEKEIMVIGGATIFEQTFPLADRLYLTIIHAKFEGDVFFPRWEETEWEPVSIESHKPDEKNRYAYTFLELRACH